GVRARNSAATETPVRRDAVADHRGVRKQPPPFIGGQQRIARDHRRWQAQIVVFRQAGGHWIEQGNRVCGLTGWHQRGSRAGGDEFAVLVLVEAEAGGVEDAVLLDESRETGNQGGAATVADGRNVDFGAWALLEPAVSLVCELPIHHGYALAVTEGDKAVRNSHQWVWLCTRTGDVTTRDATLTELHQLFHLTVDRTHVCGRFAHAANVMSGTVETGDV